jgi:KUP system potassium uptake protein
MILEACNYTDTIYIAIAGIAEVGVMMVSTTLVTLVMLLIWQNNLFMVISFLLIF